ncbi:MAG: cobalamin-dependent protein [Promethearchaeia archaeon]
MDKQEFGEILLNQKEKLAKSILERIFERVSALENIYGEKKKQQSLQDLTYHLEYLSHAILLDQPELFKKYVKWIKNVLENRGLTGELVLITLEETKNILNLEFKEKTIHDILNRFFSGINNIFQEELKVPLSFIKMDNPYNKEAQDYLDFILKGYREKAFLIIEKLEQEGVPLVDIYLNVIQPAQYEVGRLWEINQISVAREHLSTVISDTIISQFKNIESKPEKDKKTIISTCIEREQHELGIKMISNLLEYEGWKVFYIGANAPRNSILNMIKKQDADLLAISSSLINHIYLVKQLVDKIRISECSDIKILVGGKAFNMIPDLWKKVGADGYAENARKATKVVEKLLD